MLDKYLFALLLLGLGACGAPDQNRSTEPPGAVAEDRTVSPPGRGTPAVGTDFAVTTAGKDASASFAGGEDVHLHMRIDNNGDEPLELQLTGPGHDFTVSRDGQIVWQRFADMMFAQVLRSEQLAAGGTMHFEAVWTPDPAIPKGQYTITPSLVVYAGNEKLPVPAEVNITLR